MMSSNVVLPIEGNLDQVHHAFACVKKFHNTKLVLNPSNYVLCESLFEKRDCASSEFGHLLEEKKELYLT